MQQRILIFSLVIKSDIMEENLLMRVEGFTMPIPKGYEEYVTKMTAYAIIRERTGCGRYVIDNKMDELEASGIIRLIDNPGNRLSKLISKRDVEKVIEALTVPPPE